MLGLKFFLRVPTRAVNRLVNEAVMGEQDDLDSLWDELEGKEASGRRTRTNYSFRLDHANMEEFKKICHVRGVSTATMLDKLIEMFLQRGRARKRIPTK